jgi:hypothetical protein
VARAALAHAGGTFERFGTQDDEAGALLDEALALLPTADTALRCEVLARLSAVLYYSPESEQRGAALADEAVAMARRMGDPAALATALGAAQYANWRPGGAAARVAHADELLDLLGDRADALALAESHVWRAIALLELCRRAEADVEFARHASIAERVQQAPLLIHALAIKAMLALLDGRWEDGERAAAALMKAGDEAIASGSAPTPMHLQFYGVQMIALRNEQLRLPEIAPYFERLVREIGALPGWRRCAATGSPRCRTTRTSAPRSPSSPTPPRNWATPRWQPRSNRSCVR